MKDEELLNFVSVIFTRAQKAGIIGLSEASTLVHTIEVIKQKLELIEGLYKEISELTQVKEKKELKIPKSNS